MKIKISFIIKFAGESDFSYTHNWLTLRSLWHKFLLQNSTAQKPMKKAVEAALGLNPTVTTTRTIMWAV